jgi:hypothetical protein
MEAKMRRSIDDRHLQFMEESSRSIGESMQIIRTIPVPMETNLK